MSVSKSLVGTVAGALIASGELDQSRPVTDYVPALGNSGYGGATVRNLLDMRSGIRFSEGLPEPGCRGPSDRAGDRLGTPGACRCTGDDV